MRNVVSRIENVVAKLIDDNTLADFGFSVLEAAAPNGKKCCDLTVVYRHDTATGFVILNLAKGGLCQVNVVSSPSSIINEMANFNTGLKRIINAVSSAVI